MLFLALKLGNRPFGADGLLFVKAAFQRILDLQKCDVMRPTQKVRSLRTFWVREVKRLLLSLPDAHVINPTEPNDFGSGNPAARSAY
jgi:hypothetical protein